jgi:curved DNA-binding protein CbpA
MATSGEILTYYEQLDVARDAPYSEILRAFKQKSLATHPTRNPNDLTVNIVKFREICEAFDVLSQGKQRLPLILKFNCEQSTTSMVNSG